MQVATALALLERHAPRFAPRLKKWFVEHVVPMNQAIGLRIDEVADDSSRVVLRLPPRRRNLNAVGTVHGGAITALAESVHGVAVLWQFSPASHHMVSRELRIQFVAPGRGTLTTEFSLTEEVRQRIEADLTRSGSSEVELSCEVKGPQGATVARLTGSYVIRRHGRSADPGHP